jgi:large subunit ribosomal protein L4
VLVVLTDEDKNGTVYRSARNLPNVTVLNVRYLNIRDLLKHEKVIMPMNAFDWVVATWGDGKES